MNDVNKGDIDELLYIYLIEYVFALCMCAAVRRTKTIIITIIKSENQNSHYRNVCDLFIKSHHLFIT